MSDSNSASSIAKIFDVDNKEIKLKYPHGPPKNKMNFCMSLIMLNEGNQEDGTRKDLQKRSQHLKQKLKTKSYLF